MSKEKDVFQKLFRWLQLHPERLMVHHILEFHTKTLGKNLKYMKKVAEELEKEQREIEEWFKNRKVEYEKKVENHE